MQYLFLCSFSTQWGKKESFIASNVYEEANKMRNLYYFCFFLFAILRILLAIATKMLLWNELRWLCSLKRYKYSHLMVYHSVFCHANQVIRIRIFPYKVKRFIKFGFSASLMLLFPKLIPLYSRKCGEKRNPCTVNGNVIWCSHYGKKVGDSWKSKTRVAV